MLFKKGQNNLLVSTQSYSWHKLQTLQYGRVTFLKRDKNRPLAVSCIFCNTSSAFLNVFLLLMVYVISWYVTVDIHDIRYPLGRYVECFVNFPLSLRCARIKDNFVIWMDVKASIKVLRKEENRHEPHKISSMIYLIKSSYFLKYI